MRLATSHGLGSDDGPRRGDCGTDADFGGNVMRVRTDHRSCRA
jgi:hypothetical protein